MRLVVKQDDRIVSELDFAQGPIRMGRQANNQVVLADKTISRQHAALYNTQDGKWVVEDLGSANKTYLNGEAVSKTDIKNGDVLSIGDFSIAVTIEEKSQSEKPPTSAGDTVATTSKGPQIIARELDTPDAPPIRFPAQRAKDFMTAVALLNDADSADEVLLTLLDLTLTQFGAGNVWCAVRTEPNGPMTAHAGKKRGGEPVQLEQIKLSQNITQSVERHHFMLFLFARIPNQVQKGDIRSAIISPIVGKEGCYGVIYVDNYIGDEHYSLTDLDYLMLLGIHTTSILQSL
ncbi:MAG TPA: FHA domain-containing protein [Sedimentisphaerales bacterium]|nr:FHA domain-containing protein [Sedimentisphaerales bacterium]